MPATPPRNIVIPALLMAALCSVPPHCYAENIVLKSGEKIDGKIVARDGKSVKVDYRGAAITYRTYEIATIDGKPLPENVKAEEEEPLDFLLEAQTAPVDLAEVTVVTPEEHVMRGVAYHNRGNLDQAIEDFEKAIKIKPDYSAAYMYRGLTYAAKNEPDKAFADYDKAVELDPENEQAYYVRGLAYAGKKELNKAMADYDKAIELNPKYVQAYLNRSVLNIMKGNDKQVFEDAKKVIEINPRVAMAYFLRGVVYANENNLKKAIAEYNTAIMHNPNYVEAYVNRALAYAYKDKVELSKIDPNSPKAFINVSLSKSNKADFNRAIADCDKAVELAPKYTDAYMTRARIYYMANDYDKVWADIDKVEELGGKINPEFIKELEDVSGGRKIITKTDKKENEK